MNVSRQWGLIIKGSSYQLMIGLRTEAINWEWDVCVKSIHPIEEKT